MERGAEEQPARQPKKGGQRSNHLRIGVDGYLAKELADAVARCCGVDEVVGQVTVTQVRSVKKNDEARRAMPAIHSLEAGFGAPTCGLLAAIVLAETTKRLYCVAGGAGPIEWRSASVALQYGGGQTEGGS